MTDLELRRRADASRAAARHRDVRVSLVIPTRNEADNLPSVLPYIPPCVTEVVLVDTASTDGTIEVARRLRPDIVVVQEPRRGKGRALRSGFDACTGDIIVMIDADGSMDPGEIPAFVGVLLAGADLVKGSRFCQGGGSDDISRLRAFGNFFFVRLVRAIFGARYTDLCYGYSAFWASAIAELELNATGFEVETMINVRALRAGLAVAEVPSFEKVRAHGVGNLQTFPDGWRVLKVIMREGRDGHRWQRTKRRNNQPIRPAFDLRSFDLSPTVQPVLNGAARNGDGEPDEIDLTA